MLATLLFLQLDVTYPRDGAITGAAALGALAMELVPVDGQGLWEHEWLRIDEACRGRSSRMAARASDGLEAAVQLGALGVVAGTAPDGDRAGRDSLLLAESLAGTLLLQQVTKVLVRRPRPYCYAPEGGPPGRDRRLSFFSGHSASAFAAASAAGVLVQAHDPRAGAHAAVWGAGLMAATTVAGLRVQAGRHFPSDVLVGGVIGLALGIGVPIAHGADPPQLVDVVAGSGGIALGLALLWAMHFPQDEPIRQVRVWPTPFGIAGVF